MRTMFGPTKIFLGLMILLILLSQTWPLYAQLTRGGISGTVRDTSGGVIPGVQVTITNIDTNQTRSAITNENGFYRVTALEPGTYIVKIEMSGFESVENRALTVSTAQESTFNADLKVAGGSAVVVDVTERAEGVELNKTSPTVGLSVSGRQAVDLPLNGGRDVTRLALLSPGVVNTGGQTGISAHGQRARNNNFSIDGTDNNDIGVTIPTIPIIPEAVAEFQVQANPYSAEFGRNSGAQVNIITRSGTNRLRGDVWEYYQGSALNALNGSEKRQNLDRPSRFDRHQFGFDVGGPVLKDRTFFFGLLQWDRTRAFTLGTRSQIPTPAGFAALRGVPLRSGQSPASRQAVLDALGFLNGVYSQNPVFSNFTNVLVNGVPIETGSIALPVNAPVNDWNLTGRVDHRIGPRDNLTGRYAAQRLFRPNSQGNNRFGSLFNANLDDLDQNLAISETHVFSPAILNELRVSYIRRNFLFPENNPNAPTVNVGTLFSFGGLNVFPQSRIQNSFQYSDTLNWQKSRHAWKFGFDIRRIQLKNVTGFDSKGTYTFNSLQDYLNNQAFTFLQVLPASIVDARETQQFYFIQDDFHPTSNLTLNLGMRYETSGVPFGYFGTNDPVLRAALIQGPAHRSKYNFGPTFGFAYSPKFTEGFLGKVLGDGKSVIRGGYAIKYDLIFFNIITNAAQNFPYVNSINRSNTDPQRPTADLFPTVFSSAPPNFDPRNPYTAISSEVRSPYAQIYSLSLQREFARDYVLEVGYLGTLGRHELLLNNKNYAILTPEQAERVRSGQPIPGVQERRIYPQFGSRGVVTTDGNSNYNAGYVSLNKRFSKGLQIGGSYTFSKTLSVTDETLAVANLPGNVGIVQNYANVRADYGPSLFDRRHRFVVNYLYEIPWFKSGLAQNPVVKGVFSGWQISGVTTLQSGQAFGIITGVDTNGNGTPTGDRPNLDPNGTLTPDPVTGNLRSFINNGRFVVPRGNNGAPLEASLGDGNLGRNILRAPGIVNFDSSLSKRIRVREGHSLILRSDFLNIFNHPAGITTPVGGGTILGYGIPTNNMNSPNFGKNLNTWAYRTITLSAKYSF